MAAVIPGYTAPAAEGATALPVLLLLPWGVTAASVCGGCCSIWIRRQLAKRLLRMLLWRLLLLCLHNGRITHPCKQLCSSSLHLLLRLLLQLNLLVLLL